MSQTPVTIEQFKTLLEANTKVLSTQIETNREIVSIKMGELKADTEELKAHAKETNGNVKHNSDSILILKEKQYQDSKRRRRMWGISLAAITTMFGGIMTYMLHRFSSH